ncbi:MAG: glycoside hydrolase family 88 protein [Akkermansiaceae bacterium]
MPTQKSYRLPQSQNEGRRCTLQSRGLLCELALLAAVLISVATSAASAQVPTLDEVTKVIRKANNRWQETNPVHGNAFWNRAVYHVGNMDAYEITREAPYLRYSEAWAEQNQWKGAKSDNRSEWLYSYGETDRYVLFGDWQVCFQVYLKLHALAPAPEKIARTREVMAYQITTPQEDYLWWSDGLFMVMPVMTQLHRITGEDLFLEKLRTYFDYASDLMYDAEAGLFFRDAKYVYPEHKTANGKKDFWARGNGWVFAALPRVIDDLPADHQDRAHYLAIFRAMASSLAASQQEDGYWTRSILDPAHAPGPESSGTAFFTYGYLWGLRNKVLDAAQYGPVALKGWNFLTQTALQPDGTVGFIQPIGERAIPGQVVDSRSTADFGVGAFLMAAAEMARYAKTLQPISADAGPHQIRVDADGDYAETVRLDGSATILRNVGPVRMSWWLGPTFLGEGVTLDFSFPLGTHSVTLKVEHANDVPYTATTEVTVQPRAQVQPTASASGFQTGNPSANALDGNLGTRWSHQGIGQWLQLELPHPLPLDEIQIAFHLGDTRFSFFDLAVSTDGSTWQQVFTGQSSGSSTQLETFRFPSRNARYLRYIGRGNSTSDWNSVTEIRLPILTAEALDAADSDANGLPDSWEIHHFGATGVDPSLKSAYITGSDPRSPAPDPLLSIESPVPPHGYHLRILPSAAFGPGYLGWTRRYRILTSQNLSTPSWRPLPDQEILTGDNVLRLIPIDTSSAPRSFFRTHAWLE